MSASRPAPRAAVRVTSWTDPSADREIPLDVCATTGEIGVAAHPDGQRLAVGGNGDIRRGDDASPDDDGPVCQCLSDRDCDDGDPRARPDACDGLGACVGASTGLTNCSGGLRRSAHRLPPLRPVRACPSATSSARSP